MGKASEVEKAIAAIKALPPKQTRNWFTKLPENKREVMLGLRKAFQAGELEEWITGATALADYIISTYGIPKSTDLISRWLRKQQ